MTVTYDYSGVNTWDLTYPTMFINSEEIKQARRLEINRIIYIYANGIEAYSNHDIVSSELYLTLKMWATRPGVFAINARQLTNLLNPISREPMKAIEIAYLDNETNNFSMIYEIESVKTSGGMLEDGSVILDPKNCIIRYRTLRPKIEINLD